MWYTLLCVCVCTIFVKAQTAEVDSGHGLQVVKLQPRENGTTEYTLDMDLLKGLLLREDVRDKPVAVVSVAGAFRGGKSFILDFFLRYLNAPISSQENGAWLGKKKEPLRGFHWRGGSQRETTGIHLWSKPFHVKLEPTGEEVVVLLMDTQGTFDSQSSNRDSTTIFALSTLLSSVQIYNLFRNIQENDLQNLHLFTDYGSSAAADMRIFQELMFLVRDWQNPEEYAFGYNGGSQYLAKKLQVQNESTQIQELRVVRQHIRSTFENVSCFLLPHPGLKVAKGKFDGSLSDIEDDFLTSLLELAPSLFGPKHLQPKMIGGERVTAGQLLAYFEKYVEAFNSEDLPPITSITEGAAAAAIMAARDAARKEYTTRMGAVDSEPRSRTADALRTLHAAARDAARAHFTAKKFIGSQQAAEQAFDKLLKDMDQFLSSYQYNNGVKLRRGRDAAVREFNETLRSQCGVLAPAQACVGPAELASCHQHAVDAALRKFDSTRIIGANETDDERAKLLTEFTDEYNTLRNFNVKNNEKAVKEACSLYQASMESLHTDYGHAVQMMHDRAVANASSHFAALRNVHTVQEGDPYWKQMLQTIDEYFEKTMEKQNKLAMEMGKNAYYSHLDTDLNYGRYYVPSVYSREIDNAKRTAIAELGRYGIGPRLESYKEQLSQEIESSRYNLEDKNRRHNRWAASSAYYYYIQLMDGDSSAFNFSIRDDHEANKNIALRSFKRDRGGQTWYTHCADYYCYDLENRMDRAFDDNYASFWSRIG